MQNAMRTLYSLIQQCSSIFTNCNVTALHFKNDLDMKTKLRTFRSILGTGARKILNYIV